MSGVDVVVPCYNYGRFLECCVRSVLDQEGVGVRVLVIDDASSDDTAEIAARLAMQDNRVQFRRHYTNRGHIATYNEGLLEWASAKYSLLISADDMLAPGALSRASLIMDQHADVGMTYGTEVFIGEDESRPAPGREACSEYQIVSGERFLERCFAVGNPVSTPTAVVRTCLQRQVGGYSVDLPHSGDLEMWMRLAAHGAIGVIRAVQGYYRWHGKNMSRVNRVALLRDMSDVEAACERVAMLYGRAFDRSKGWLAAMRRRFGEDAFWAASSAFDNGEVSSCRACLRVAERYRPGLWKSAVWWRLRAKMLSGPMIWHAVVPWLDQARGVTAPRTTRSEAPPVGREFGWWPDPSEYGPVRRLVDPARTHADGGLAIARDFTQEDAAIDGVAATESPALRGRA